MTPQQDQGSSSELAQMPGPRRVDGSRGTAVAPRVPAARRSGEHVVGPAAAGAARGRWGWRSSYIAASVATDLVAATAAALLGVAVRFSDTAPTMYIELSIALIPLWMAFVALSRAYERRFIGVGIEEFTRILRAGVALLAVAGFISYATKLQLSREYVVIAIPSLAGFSLLGRAFLRHWLHRERSAGRCVQRTVMVGSTAAIARTVQRLHADPSHGIHVVGACVPSGAEEAALYGLDFEAICGVEGLETLVRTTGAEVVTVLSSALITGDELRRLAWRLEACGTELIVCAGLTEISGSRVTIRPAAFSPLLLVAQARLAGPARVVKGVIDRLSALIGLILISPLLIGVALAVWQRDRANPFFCQTRVGLGRKEFRLIKFRTMVVDAEARKADLMARNESDGVLFKIAQDPRITPLGRWLRRYSIDELPQLINVLRGEMSLVGPRPPLPSEVAAYGADMQRRLLVKPGMTGLWQVSGRSSLTWAQTEQLDIRYVENWSLAYDLMILWRTLRAVLSADGAH